MIAFLSPLFLLGAAAAAVPIVLHLLKRPPEQRVRFAAVAFLRGASIEQTSRRRLREWLLLVLRVSALVLLALAFARPFLSSAKATVAAGATVVALDTSFSMSAPGRFERAKTLAKDAIRSAPPDHDVAVVTFADRAEIVVHLTSDRGGAFAAVDATTPGFGSTRYRAGVKAAGSLISGLRGNIVVVTDLQESGWDSGDLASIPEGTQVEIRDVGALPENLAITALRVEPDRVVATIHNAGIRDRRVRVRLSVEGRAAGDAVASVAAGASADATFSNVRGSVAGADRGAVAASIDDPDGIQADNVRYALLEGTTRAAVLLVTATGDLDRDAFYLQQALVAGLESGRHADGVSAAQLSGWPVERVARYAAVMLVSTRGLEPRGRETLAAYVAGGGGLLIAAGPEVDGDVIANVLGTGAELKVAGPAGGGAGGSATPRTLAPADVRHPIFQSFGAEVASLGLVTFRSAGHVGGSACRTIANFTSGDAAVVDCAAGEGRAIVVASDLNNQWNDFPVHASFVPFVHEAVRYLSGTSLQAAEYLVGDVPAGISPVPGIAVAPARPGGPTGRTRRIAVNVDTRESNPGRMSADAFQAAVARLKANGVVSARRDVAQQEGRQRLWQYLIGAMLVALAVEGVVAGRSA